MEPLGGGREHLQDRDTQTPDLSLPAKPTVTVQKVYESAPQVRDLRKEATQRFVPSVVKQKIDASKGKGKLLEEEELEQLEREGYGGTAPLRNPATVKAEVSHPIINAAPAVDDQGPDYEHRRLEEEEERFRREMAMAEEENPTDEYRHGKGVTMEEVDVADS